MMIIRAIAVQDSQLFITFADVIALDHNVRLQDRHDLRELFESLCELGSFNRKLSPVKSGRWFSWNGAAEQQMTEFWSTRMLLQYKFPDTNPEDVKKSFNQLRSDAGGLKLGLSCCSWSTWFGAQVLQIAGKPLWTDYTETVEGVKSPEQGLRHTIKMTTSWMNCKQLVGLVDVLSATQEYERLIEYHVLSRRQLDHDSHTQLLRTFVEQMWFYVLSLLSKRSSTLSKLNSPPECYSAILKGGADARPAKQLLRDDWKLLCLAEQSAAAKHVVADMQCCVSPPMRLAYAVAESGNEQLTHNLLKSMLLALPDTKFIEDIHGHVKTDAKSHRHGKQNVVHIQHIITTSQELEKRGIPHPARLNKTSFLRRWKRTKALMSNELFFSKHHKLPKEFSRIMGPKFWGSLGEDQLARGAAAFEWLRVYFRSNLKEHHVRLNEARPIIV